ncbi:MAG: hypothetical protein ACRDNZ_22645, partial [Streptosporangiaceae bacterium]
VWAARAIGSKGSSSGVGTGTRYPRTERFHEGERDYLRMARIHRVIAWRGWDPGPHAGQGVPYRT